MLLLGWPRCHYNTQAPFVFSLLPGETWSRRNRGRGELDVSWVGGMSVSLAAEEDEEEGNGVGEGGGGYSGHAALLLRPTRKSRRCVRKNRTAADFAHGAALETWKTPRPPSATIRRSCARTQTFGNPVRCKEESRDGSSNGEGRSRQRCYPRRMQR